MSNPILATWSTPFELAPFDTISDDDFAPAICGRRLAEVNLSPENSNE